MFAWHSTSKKIAPLAICFLQIIFFSSSTKGIGILILLSSFSKLKPPIILSISLVGTSTSVFSGFLVCVVLVSTGFV
jgi:hypothetical protein